jgi:hypothetical protein
MRGSIMILAATAMLALAGCATDSSSTPRSQQLWTPQGEPVNCITLSQIRSTNVIDDRTIHFVMNGRDRMFRNELPFACSGLGFNRAFKHNSRTSQLCSVDTITVIQSGRRGPTCGLGRFQPMVPVPAATPVAK